MSSYLDNIPQAVATIVSSCVAQNGKAKNEDQLELAEKWVLDLTEKVTRTLVTAMREAEGGKQPG